MNYNFKRLQIQSVWRFDMQLNIILILIFAILVTLFTIFNASPVIVNLFFTEMNVSLALIIIISVLAGAILVALIDTYRKFVNSKKIKIANKKILELENQILIKDEALRQRDLLIAQKEEKIQELKHTLEKGISTEA